MKKIGKIPQTLSSLTLDSPASGRVKCSQTWTIFWDNFLCSLSRSLFRRTWVCFLTMKVRAKVHPYGPSSVFAATDVPMGYDTNALVNEFKTALALADRFDGQGPNR